jgi:hypothetical protein
MKTNEEIISAFRMQEIIYAIGNFRRRVILGGVEDSLGEIFT